MSRYVSVPCAAAFLLGISATGSFRRWERSMYLCIGASLVAIPLLILTQAGHRSSIARLPSTGGAHASGLLLVVALVGTTVAPWQLFFQQSNVVDKRITARFIGYERIDTAVGTALFAVGALAILLACAFAFDGTSLHGTFTDAAGVARGLRVRVGPLEGGLFAVALLNGSLIGASAVTLATSYAVGDYFGLRHSLHRRWGAAPSFYRTYAISVLVAGAVVLLPGVPLGLLTTAVQALAGILLPSATVFLLLLCNDRAVLGPWVNPRWLNAIAITVVGCLLVLSALLTLTTVFRSLALVPMAAGLGSLLVVALTVIGLATHQTAAPEGGKTTELPIWTMPPIESLERPAHSRGRSFGLIMLRGYLALAVVLLAIKVVRIVVGG